MFHRLHVLQQLSIWVNPQQAGDWTKHTSTWNWWFFLPEDCIRCSWMLLKKENKVCSGVLKSLTGAPFIPPAVQRSCCTCAHLCQQQGSFGLHSEHAILSLCSKRSVCCTPSSSEADRPTQTAGTGWLKWGRTRAGWGKAGVQLLLANII